MSNVKPWPKPTGKMAQKPRRIVRPCDSSLLLAVYALEGQLGTIEAYNRLVAAANVLRAKVERGEAQAQNPIFATSVRGE